MVPHTLALLFSRTSCKREHP